MASLKDTRQLAQDLTRRAGELEKALEDDVDFARVSALADEVGAAADAFAVNADIHPRIKEDRPLRTVRRVDIQRRKPARHAPEGVKGQRAVRSPSKILIGLQEFDRQRLKCCVRYSI